jgi:hypothetical protein
MEFLCMDEQKEFYIMKVEKEVWDILLVQFDGKAWKLA